MRDDKLHMFSAVHLHHEIDMCRRTAGLLAGAPDGVLNNVLVESYAIHLRALVEFLFDRRKHPDNLRASDFVKVHETWLLARGQKSETLNGAQRRANKQIAQFTKKRFADGGVEKHWRPRHEISELVAQLRMFLRCADPEKLHPIVSDAVAALASLVGEAGRAGGEHGETR